MTVSLASWPPAHRLGFGSATLGNLYRALDDETAKATRDTALAGGIGYVDTAPHYGQGLSERRLAQLDEAVILSSKVGRVLRPIAAPPLGTERHGFVDGDPFEPEFDYSRDGVLRSFEDSLKRLKRDRIDILLAHDLGALTHGEAHPRHLRDFLEGGYPAMCELKAEGRITAIGLGINETEIAETVLGHADLDMVMLAGRYTLLEQGALDHFLPLCAARGVQILAAGPFNSGILSGGAAYNYAPAPDSVRARVARLEAVCRAFDVPLAAAALQFPLAHPAVAVVVAGMASPAEVRANLALMQTPIPAALWAALKTEGLIRQDAPCSE
ncbi:aldo/keto reductase [Asticcacaulis sp. EMRT-3]|uniref:aldo/keto reductase n=1 Tax=Asticcacaulis sp. EMRT-3 TaxID=3040349 RepID=UPI0024AEDF01|nr:aldo/keto reductase [Asticcacaulis sp. EMRT-3]MDI7775711.1 aldo/keto reductase [Asticcacaulis sp. EMRT-3]